MSSPSRSLPQPELPHGFCCSLTEALTQGNEVRISGFGSFGISERSERQGRNPQTGEAITIAASKAAKFTAAKAVKDVLNGD